MLHCYAGRATPAALVAIALFWGAAHTSGLIVAQVWLTSEAYEAPEFAVGVYISAINLGVTAGAVWSGLLLAACALPLIGAKLALYGAAARLPAR